MPSPRAPKALARSFTTSYVQQMLPDLFGLNTTRTLPGVTIPVAYRKLVATRLSTNFTEAAEVVEVRTPELESGQLLIKVMYCAVNASDRLKSAGYYGDKAPPVDLGLEGLGQIVAVGPHVPASFLGKYRALSDTGERGGMFAEYVVGHAVKGTNVPVPSGDRKYAAIMVTGFSIAVVMNTECTPKKGETILITAAAGSGGTFAVQMAKRRGAHVIGMCGSADKARMLRDIGCDRVINYREENADEVLTREYPKGVNWVLEMVGGETYDMCIDHLAERGRMIVFGFMGDQEASPTQTQRITNQRLLMKSASIQGFAVKHYLKSGFLHGFRFLGAVKRGDITPVIDPTEFVGIESIPAAVAHHNAGKNIGKVLIRMP